MTDRPADKALKAQAAGASSGKAAREAKLAAALRVNLTRRKAAARAANAGGDGDTIKNNRDDEQA